MERLQHIVGQLQPPRASIHSKDCHQNSSHYRYTLDEFADEILTKQQRDFYEENGYIVIKNLLPIEDVNICNRRFDDIVSIPNLRLNEFVLMRDVALLNKKNKLTKNRTASDEVTKLQVFANDPVFIKHYLAHPKILKYLKAFVGSDLRSWHHMFCYLYTHSLLITKVTLLSKVHQQTNRSRHSELASPASSRFVVFPAE